MGQFFHWRVLCIETIRVGFFTGEFYVLRPYGSDFLLESSMY